MSLNYYHLRYIREQNNRRARIEHRANLRSLRDKSDPFSLPSFRFQKLFRINKHSADFLISKLESKAKKTSIPFRIKLLCALHFYGHGSYQVSTGSCHMIALSQPSVSRCVREITHLIVTHLLNDVIKFPQDTLRQAEVKEAFVRKFNMHGVLGAIDGCHIAITSPPEDDEYFRGNLFRNRKGYHSLNTLVCCDANMRIIYANARFPGSVHDSAIWTTSQLRRYFVEQFSTVANQNNVLLGDSGFPLEPWLLVPYSNPESGTNKFRYNENFIKTRNIVEKCFGVVKSRFRCLLRHRTLHHHPTVAFQIIYAVFVLHNLCLDYNHLDNDNSQNGSDENSDNSLCEDDSIGHDDNDDSFIEVTDDDPTSGNSGNSTWYNLGCTLREAYVNKYFN